MRTPSRVLLELAAIVAVVSALTLAIWPWQRGAGVLAFAVGGAMLVSSLIANRARNAPAAWRQACVQAVFAALVTWLVARWLHA
jgi:hypothetical protein